MSSKKIEKSTKSHRCRCEIKKNKVIYSKRSKIINNANNVTKAILEEHRLWKRPEFSALRHFVHAVTNNPSKLTPTTTHLHPHMKIKNLYHYHQISQCKQNREFFLIKIIKIIILLCK